MALTPNMIIKTFTLIALMITVSNEVRKTNATLQPEDSTFGEIFELPNTVNSLDVKASIGKVFSIKIRGNPTTGYGWYLENVNSIDRNTLEPLNLNQHNSATDFVTDPHAEGMVGVGGSYFFKFRAKQAVENLKLTFVNKRPWETTNERVATVNVNIE